VTYALRLAELEIDVLDEIIKGLSARVAEETST
jgi:hypothetical protein